jgi:Transposase and inactivated derivatives
MSTSLLYHGFGLVGYTYVRTVYEEGKVIFTVKHKGNKLHCPECGSRDLVLRGCTPRRFRMVPIGSKVTFLDLGIQRVACRRCDTIRQVDLGFADPRFSYTRAFERYVLGLSKHMTILDVARHLSVSWDTIKDIQKRYLKKKFSRPPLKDLRHMAIDEIAVKKGHRYLTVVLDLESGAVIFVGEGKGAEALEPFWKRLKHSQATVDAVAIDMSPAYISAVMKHLPGAVIVFDHFHVVKLFNDKLSDLRRDLYREAKDQLQKDVLKGTRWLLLKRPDHLDEKKGEKERLEEALRLNEPLYTAYYLKEELREVWTQPGKKQALRVLDEWIQKASSSGIAMLKTMAKTLSAYKSGILGYYDFPISTGPLEGTNNKIKTMKRQAYGFRDMEFFKLKIMALHETKYALVG